MTQISRKSLKYKKNELSTCNYVIVFMIINCIGRAVVFNQFNTVMSRIKGVW